MGRGNKEASAENLVFIEIQNVETNNIDRKEKFCSKTPLFNAVQRKSHHPINLISFSIKTFNLQSHTIEHNFQQFRMTEINDIPSQLILLYPHQSSQFFEFFRIC